MYPRSMYPRTHKQYRFDNAKHEMNMSSLSYRPKRAASKPAVVKMVSQPYSYHRILQHRIHSAKFLQIRSQIRY